MLRSRDQVRKRMEGGTEENKMEVRCCTTMCWFRRRRWLFGDISTAEIVLCCSVEGSTIHLHSGWWNRSRCAITCYLAWLSFLCLQNGQYCRYPYMTCTKFVLHPSSSTMALIYCMLPPFPVLAHWQLCVDRCCYSLAMHCYHNCLSIHGWFHPVG